VLLIVVIYPVWVVILELIDVKSFCSKLVTLVVKLDIFPFDVVISLLIYVNALSVKLVDSKVDTRVVKF